MPQKNTLLQNRAFCKDNPQFIYCDTLLEQRKRDLYEDPNIQPARRINAECYDQFVTPSTLEKSLVWALVILLIVCFWVQAFKWVGVL